MIEAELQDIKTTVHRAGEFSAVTAKYFRMLRDLLTHIDALQERIAELEADTVWANFSPATVRTETATAILRDILEKYEAAFVLDLCLSDVEIETICRAHGAKG